MAKADPIEQHRGQFIAFQYITKAVMQSNTNELLICSAMLKNCDLYTTLAAMCYVDIMSYTLRWATSEIMKEFG